MSTNLDNGLGDLPILDVELDPATGDLYAAHDYGVLRLPAEGRHGFAQRTDCRRSPSSSSR